MEFDVSTVYTNKEEEGEKKHQSHSCRESNSKDAEDSISIDGEKLFNEIYEAQLLYEFDVSIIDIFLLLSAGNLIDLSSIKNS